MILHELEESKPDEPEGDKAPETPLGDPAYSKGKGPEKPRTEVSDAIALEGLGGSSSACASAAEVNAADFAHAVAAALAQRILSVRMPEAPIIYAPIQPKVKAMPMRPLTLYSEPHWRPLILTFPLLSLLLALRMTTTFAFPKG